jgi:hypothetical protein
LIRRPLYCARKLHTPVKRRRRRRAAMKVALCMAHECTSVGEKSMPVRMYRFWSQRMSACRGSGGSAILHGTEAVGTRERSAAVASGMIMSGIALILVAVAPPPESLCANAANGRHIVGRC